MKFTSILLKSARILFLLSIISCTNETTEDLNIEGDETVLDISQLNSAKNYKLLKKFNNCFSLITEVEVTETIIDEETGEVIETITDEVVTEETTDDYNEITFPITIVLNEETIEVTIADLEELITLIETCKTEKHDCNKGDDDEEDNLTSSEINAGILIKYEKCFEVIIEQETEVTEGGTASEKRVKSRSKYSNHDYSYSDLTFPIVIIFDKETVEITSLEELTTLIKTCKKRGCDTETEVPEVEDCSLTVELIEEFDGESITINVVSEDENLTYEWSTGETTSFIYVFANSVNTTYTVDVTDEEGCTTTESLTIVGVTG